MSDTTNPFEQAENIGGEGFDPFSSNTTDPFGSIPHATEISHVQNSPPSLNLGSMQTVENPFTTPTNLRFAGDPGFESTAASSVGTSNATPSTPPVIDLGSQSGTAAPFTTDEQSTALTRANAGAQLRLVGDADAVNPIEAAMTKQEQSEQQSVFSKAPIFEHGAVKDPIEDLNQTFEDLRVAKSDDFPELEDAVRVSWDVTYGKIRKTVPTPKKTKIGEFKKSIETSKEFLEALKKDKNKSPDCIIKPRITAQSKGEQRDAAPILRYDGETKAFSSYKALFLTLEDAQKSGKIISIVPGSDGKVYEIRREEAGTFITPSGECRELSEIRAGFTPALPLIPNHELRRIIGFFRSVMRNGENFEAIANVYWDRESDEYRVVIPRQHVTAIGADSDLSDDYDHNRFLHYMDIHSHNVMAARFSEQDDRDEKATRLYAVIGNLHEFIPEMSVRLSNGGKYLLIDPSDVFESFGDYYPEEWNAQITFGGNAAPVIHRYEYDGRLRSFLSSLVSKGLMCA